MMPCYTSIRMKANASTRCASMNLRLVITSSLVFLTWHDPAHARNPQARAQFQAASMCLDVPPSLNPWGKECAAQVATRWAACSESSKARVGALHDCLGFKRPLPLSAIDARKAQALRKATLDFCSSVPSQVKTMDRCRDELAERFEWCGPPYITHEISDDAFMGCLGLPARLLQPPSVKTLASCQAHDIKAHFSATVAHVATWPGSKARAVSGKTLYVAASPIFDERDAQTLRLEEGKEDAYSPEADLWTKRPKRRASVELTPAATKRLAEATDGNVGEFVVLSLEGEEVAYKIEGRVGAGRLYFDAGKRGPTDICR